jgi:hypothetical protein
MQPSPYDTNELDGPGEADRAKAAAVDALKARIEVEEQAERSKLRADEALQAQRAAEEAAERARAEAEEAEQARRAADKEAEQARVAAEEALQTWREKLAKALEVDVAGEAEVAGEQEESAPPAAEAELPAALEGQVANLTDLSVDEEPLAEPARHRTCVVSYRREFRKVTFYARAFDDAGNELVVAESQPFRARGNGAPDPTEQAIDALEGLGSQLLGDGWEVAGFGDAWFERMFRRRVGAAVG